MAAVEDSLQTLEVAAQGAWLVEDAPREEIPEHAMTPVAAMRLVTQELAVEGIPERNLATFVTTWMEPEARQVIDENLHRNFIDHAEYPMTAEIQQRCIRMLAELFNAPGETTGARTQGSSEAIMLGALSLKWKWRERREAAGKSTDKPNLVFGGDVHVVWEKFCRYFDVEPRIVPLQPGKYTIGPEDIEPHLDENTIGVAAVVGTTFTGHADDVVGINDLLVELKDDKGLDVPLHIDGASGAFVWPFLYPRLEVGLPPRAGALDQRLRPQVRPGLPGDRLADLPREVRPRRGPRLLRELPGEDRRNLHAQLLDRLRDGARPVLQLRPLRQGGLPADHGDHAEERRALAADIDGIGKFQIIGKGEETLPLVAFNLAEEHAYDEFDIAFQLPPSGAGWFPPTRCRRTPRT